MFKLTTPSGVFGPFSVVETLDDRYHCDGIDFPFTVVGQGTFSEALPGDFPAPPAPPPAVPSSVTARQAVQALILAGIDEEDVEAAIAAMTDPMQRKLARNFWLRSNEFERANPYLNALAGALGLDSAALDALFVTASTL